MWKRILAGTLGLCLSAGCSISPIHYAVVNTASLADMADVRLIDPNDGPYLIKVMQTNDGGRDFWWEIDSQIEQRQPCRVKYHGQYSTAGFMVVEGEIGDGKKRYPVVLDTGATQAVFVKDVHVLDNELAIYPIGTHDTGSDSYSLGLCYLPELRIGEVAFVNPACFYLERRMEFKLFGLLPIARDDSIILGLPAMREFKYIVFDSVRKEVEFSHSEEFEPADAQLWERYPFSIEEDWHGNAFLFVEVPVAGERIELQLDTGSGEGLAISEELWERISDKIQDVRLKEGSELYPYIGQLSCKQGVIGELQLGDRTVKDARISIFPNDSGLVSDCEGLLGMGYFRDTVMVLDFASESMWVKSPQS